MNRQCFPLQLNTKTLLAPKIATFLNEFFQEGCSRPTMKCRMYGVDYIYRLVSQNSS